MRPVVLTGFMGTGKTTVGRALAERLGVSFIDTDQEIQRRTGLTVSQVFEQQGEASFRALERQVLRGLPMNCGCVIATGGGTLVPEDSETLLPTGARIVCLTAEVQELRRRLSGASDRPLLIADDDRLVRLLRDRAEAYVRFERLDTTGLSVAQVVEELAARIAPSPAASIRFESGRTSEIHFGSGLFASLGDLLLQREIRGDVMILTDERVDELGHANRVADALRGSGFIVHRALIRSGEDHKSLETLQDLFLECMAAHLDRHAVVVAVGGGVVCDVGGMVAATYLRGLRLVLVPTTLLAQADAAVGGKVGVDLAGAKNLVGAFYPAELVVIDPEPLQTLPDPALGEGLAEIVKTGAILSAPMLEEVESLESANGILTAPGLIRAAAVAKAELVGEDPYERGRRMLLNFGHTVGHGIEAASGYQLAHGAAVSVGMVAETRLAERKGWCAPGLATRLRQMLERLALPVAAEGIDAERAWEFMTHDKKRTGDRLRFALPLQAGQGKVFDVSGEDARWALEAALKDGS